MSELFTRSFQLFKLTIRRDRLRASIWIFALTFFTLIIPSSFQSLYPDQQDRDAMAVTMENPAMVAMVGRGDLDNYTIGAMSAHQMVLITAVFVGIMSILLFVRHTRTDEEEGRVELIRALPVGRLATIHAATMYVVLVNVVLAALVAIGFMVQPIESIGIEGSLLYGATLGGTGICFVAVASLFTQLSDSSRGATGWSIGLLLFFYVLRAIGDIGNETLSLLSPLGWTTQTMIFTENHWWPILLMGAFSFVILLLAYRLNAKRDLEAGLFPSKPGNAHAANNLLSPFGLAFRLQRTAFISWAVGMLLLGISYGSVLGDLDSFFQGNEMIEKILVQEKGYSIADQFISIIMTVMAMIATIPALISMNKLYSEEKKSRLELLYAKPVSRKTMMASYLSVAVINAFVSVVLSGIGLWAAGSMVMDNPVSLGTIIGASIAYIPAMFVMIGLSALLIGLKPNVLSLTWVYLVYSFIVVYMGNLFQLDEWFSNVTPFGHVSQLPVDEFEVIPFLGLSGVVVIFVIAGLSFYSKRDIQG
ncbi:ABC transporter permease [Allobacillus sp. GCM10007491]|uniref:ABC transporter permease n=1 Tax=Allobacillus saliphilus TaxID=2912308 RepID=A0A941HT10_9BACI|nr:ABC transporter permease [Allobacillus saliphilus]MBR7553958.1 ABC transporter permease [Allobacillus saliphilus]